MIVLTGIVALGQLLLAAIVSYLLLLTVSAFRATRRTALLPVPRHRFLILIPAHDEERLLPRLLASLAALDYPGDLYAVHVVADNCSDDTARLARAAGAVVYERFDEKKRGKGYALEWLLARLRAEEETDRLAADAVLILDADSSVSSNFLRVMDARLAAGERAIQAYYTVENPEEGWSAALRSVALAALHYLRPQGRMVLGGSVGLKGNGMTFAAELLERHRWSASLTEDIEYHMSLVLDGERVTFAPDATVSAEMPASLDAADSQNVRWEQGRLQMARRYVPRLLTAAVRAAEPRRAFLLLDAAAEHLIPPFSILAALSLLLAPLAWFLPRRRRPFLRALLRALSLFNLLGQAVYVLAGLRLVRAPAAVYRALLYAPFFLLWKVWLYVRVWLGERQAVWTRTSRS